MGSIASPATPSSPMPAASTTLMPTWHGYVSDTRDALMLFEAVLSGPLTRVVRRPHDRERANLIRSGSVFIYEEDRSGIKRWTDGVPWSPSRILNNFLIYRELDKPFPPGEKKRAKKPKREAEDTTAGQEMTDGGLASPNTTNGPASPSIKSESSQKQDIERSLVGSLTDSYAFKVGGLVKKTMSVTVQGVHYHLVSYYTPDDVKNSTLQRPGDCDLRFVQPRIELTHQQNFRAPIDEGDEAVTTSPYPNRQQFIAAQPSYMQPPGYSSQQMPYQHQQAYYAQMPTPTQDPYGEAHRSNYGLPSSPHAQQQFYQSMGRGQNAMHQHQQHSLAQQQQQQQGPPQQQAHGQFPHQQQPRQHMPQYPQYQDMRSFQGSNPYQQNPQQMHSWSSPQG